MQTLILLGGMGWTLLSFLGTGLPLGIPPEKEEPIMSYVAPDECVLYATWAAMATPSPLSSNQTVLLLAEPEVQAFVAAVQRNVLTAALAAAKKNGTPPEQADKIGKTVSLWIRTVFTRSGALYVTRLARRGSALDVQGGLLIKAGDAATELDQSLTELLTSQGVNPVETTVVGRKFRKLSIPAEEPIDVVWGAGNGYMMIGLGAGALEEMSARIRAQKEPAWLTQLKANLPLERRSTISYVNLKKLMDTFVPLGGPEAEKIVNALGLKQLTSLQAVTGLDQSGMVSRSLLAIDGQPRGLLALLDEKGISAGDLKHIPADVLVAAAFVVDPRKTYDAVMSAVTEIDPSAAEQAKAAVQQIQAQLGINVPEALGALGSHWTLHASPSDGGWMAAALTIEVRNKERLLDTEKRLLSKLQDPSGEIPNVGRIARTSFAGQSIASLTFRVPNLAAVAPSWCVTDKQLIVGANAQAVKSILSRQSGDKSLAEVQEIAARLSGANAPLALSYYDTPRSFAATYTSAQALLPVLSSMAQQASIPFDLTAAQLPNQRTVSRHLLPSVMTMRRTAKGLEMETRQTLPGLSVGPSTGVAVALLLPAVQAAREAARRQQSANHIKQQLLALHNFHDVYRCFPPAYAVSKDGKPLLSWRVAILPHLEQNQLFEQFRLDEPWDSEHNKSLIAKMPSIFRSPNSSAKPGMTNYLGVGGPRGVLVPPAQAGTSTGISLSAIPDGTANTIAIVEGTDALAVEWTKPVEWVPDQKDPLKGLLGMRPGGFLAGFVDGHIQFISRSVDPQMLLAAFGRDDGKPIQWPEERPMPPGPGFPPPRGKAPPPPQSKAPAKSPRS